jgi:hypothetical protein
MTSMLDLLREWWTVLPPLQRRHTRTGHQMSGPREPAKARQMIKPRAEMAVVTVIAPPMRVAI